MAEGVERQRCEDLDILYSHKACMKVADDWYDQLDKEQNLKMMASWDNQIDLIVCFFF